MVHPNHKPKHQYDCSNCKFGWCCSYLCQCNYPNLPKPPMDIQIEVNKQREENNFTPEFDLKES